MASVTLRAYAKINLSLRIKDARPDGYHEVVTILQAIDVFDRVTITPRRGPFGIRCDAPGVPLDRTNLVWKAALHLWRAAGLAGEPRNVAITLEKHIPMQAGLGGGSSDAAAALLGLRRFWKLRVSDREVTAIAAQLGSDVPYFFVGGTALGLGRGEEVYALEDLPPLWVVLVMPPFGVATRDAYAWLDTSRNRGRVENGGRVEFPRWQGNSTRPQFSRPLFPNIVLGNDLEAPVAERHPLIGGLKQRLEAAGAALAAMSGSGSTVFGVFESSGEARAAARALKRDGARVLLTRFRPRRRA